MERAKGLILAVALTAAAIAASITLFLLGGGFVMAFIPVEMPIDAKAEHANAMAKLAAARDRYERWVAIADAAFWSVDAGDFRGAGHLADEAMAMSAEYCDDWNYGNVLHKVQLTRGRIALRSGAVSSASYFLREAGKTPGSPQLNTFGPNMRLADELLKAGERRAVEDYLDEVARFWKMDSGALIAWRWQVRWGIAPNFGANLVY